MWASLGYVIIIAQAVPRLAFSRHGQLQPYQLHGLCLCFILQSMFGITTMIKWPEERGKLLILIIFF